MASLPDPASTPDIRVAAPDTSGLVHLLQYEAELRRHASVNELVYHLANETRRIVDYGQMFVLKAARGKNSFKVDAVSSLATVDGNAPLVQAIEKTLTGNDLAIAREWDGAAFSNDSALEEYPFQHWRWQPLKDRAGTIFGGILLARDVPFLAGEGVRVERVAETAAHSWIALAGGTPMPRFGFLGKGTKKLFLIPLAITAFFPVRMTALAPVEVIAERPFVVAAPFPGVIARVEVEPNGKVNKGQAVLTFEDVKVRNEMQQALERVQIAKAKIEQSANAAFGDKEKAGDIATLRAEYEAARTDYNYAREIMAKSQVAAPVAGLAIYSDRRDWEGRAVNVGDPILQIADPAAVTYRIDLPTKEQFALETGAPVKIWLDAQPLASLDAQVVHASYQARMTPEGVLSFTVTARPPVGQLPRIGSRGTAKLYGDRMPFIYTLLRRPIASLRQFVGW